MSKFEPGAVLCPDEYKEHGSNYDYWLALALVLVVGGAAIADIISKLKS